MNNYEEAKEVLKAFEGFDNVIITAVQRLDAFKKNLAIEHKAVQFASELKYFPGDRVWVLASEHFDWHQKNLNPDKFHTRSRFRLYNDSGVTVEEIEKLKLEWTPEKELDIKEETIRATAFGLRPDGNDWWTGRQTMKMAEKQFIRIMN